MTEYVDTAEVHPTYRALDRSTTGRGISAELGVPALAIYLLLPVSTIKNLTKVETDSAARKLEPFYYLSIVMQASLIGFMASSFLPRAAYFWYLYYLIGFAVCVTRLFCNRARAGANIK